MTFFPPPFFFPLRYRLLFFIVRFFFFGLCCDTLFVLIASVYFSEVGVFCFREKNVGRGNIVCIVAGYWKYVELYFLGGYI